MPPEPNTHAMTDAFQIAAAWWMTKAKGGSFPRIGTDDGMAEILLVLAGATAPGKTERAEKFGRALLATLEKRAHLNLPFMSLMTDYGPEGILVQACDLAGFYPPLPMKTHMSIRPDEVTVSVGYHGPTVTIWERATGTVTVAAT